jgi:hypothetical protein
VALKTAIRACGNSCTNWRRPCRPLAVGEIQVEQDGIDIALAPIDIERFAQRARLEPFELDAEQFGVKRLGAVADELVIVDEEELSPKSGALVRRRRRNRRGIVARNSCRVHDDPLSCSFDPQ